MSKEAFKKHTVKRIFFCRSELMVKTGFFSSKKKTSLKYEKWVKL